MEKNPYIYLQHILSSIQRIQTYMTGLYENQFYQNELVQDGVIRNLQIIGEATKNIPASFKSQHQNIPWKKMAGMRDKLIHDYISVDLEAVWIVVSENLPQLQVELQNITNRPPHPG